MRIQTTKFTAFLVVAAAIGRRTIALWLTICLAMPSPALALRLSQEEAKPGTYDQHSQELAVGNGVASPGDSHVLREGQENVTDELIEALLGTELYQATLAPASPPPPSRPLPPQPAALRADGPIGPGAGLEEGLGTYARVVAKTVVPQVREALGRSAVRSFRRETARVVFDKKVTQPEQALVLGEDGQFWIHLHLVTENHNIGLLSRLILRDGYVEGAEEVMAETNAFDDGAPAERLTGFVSLEGRLSRNWLKMGPLDWLEFEVSQKTLDHDRHLEDAIRRWQAGEWQPLFVLGKADEQSDARGLFGMLEVKALVASGTDTQRLVSPGGVEKTTLYRSAVPVSGQGEENAAGLEEDEVLAQRVRQFLDIMNRLEQEITLRSNKRATYTKGLNFGAILRKEQRAIEATGVEYALFRSLLLDISKPARKRIIRLMKIPSSRAKESPHLADEVVIKTRAAWIHLLVETMVNMVDEGTSLSNLNINPLIFESFLALQQKPTGYYFIKLYKTLMSDEMTLTLRNLSERTVKMLGITSSEAGLEERLTEGEFIQQIAQEVAARFDPLIQRLSSALSNVEMDLNWGEFRAEIFLASRELETLEDAVSSLLEFSSEVDPAWGQDERWRRYEQHLRYTTWETFQLMYGMVFTLVAFELPEDMQRGEAYLGYIRWVLRKFSNEVKKLQATKRIPEIRSNLSHDEWDRLLTLQQENWAFFGPFGKNPLPLLMPVENGPFHPSRLIEAAEMMKAANVDKNSHLFDLGVGTGHALMVAAVVFGAQATGIDLNEMLLRIGRGWRRNLLAKGLLSPGQVRFRKGDFLKARLRGKGYTHFYSYPPGSVEFQREMDAWMVSEAPPGSQLIVIATEETRDNIETLWPNLAARWRTVPLLPNGVLFKEPATWMKGSDWTRITEETPYETFKVGGWIEIPEEPKAKEPNPHLQRIITRLDDMKITIETHTRDDQGRIVWNTSAQDSVVQLAARGATYRDPPAGLEEVVGAFRRLVAERFSELEGYLPTEDKVANLTDTDAGRALQRMAKRANLEGGELLAVPTSAPSVIPEQVVQKIYVPARWRDQVAANFQGQDRYRVVGEKDRDSADAEVIGPTANRETLLLENKILFEVQNEADAKALTPGLIDRLTQEKLILPGLGTLIIIQSLTAPEFRDVVLIFA